MISFFHRVLIDRVNVDGGHFDIMPVGWEKLSHRGPCTPAREAGHMKKSPVKANILFSAQSIIKPLFSHDRTVFSMNNNKTKC